MRPIRSGAVRVGAVVAAAAALASCSAAPPEPGRTNGISTPATGAAPATTDSGTAVPGDGPRRPEIESVVTTGLAAPWSIAFHGGTPLISERDSARILELGPDGRTREVGTIPGVTPGGESGLLGIAVRGDELYVYSTGAAADHTTSENRIERYRLTGRPGSLGLADGTRLLGGIPAAGHHDGGRLAFGPDGMLYATTGDAGDREAAQDRGSLAGKILRLAPDGAVPADNPFPGSYVYSYGHRNPQGLGWAADGTLYASEFGQDTWDELNAITAGANYGWPVVEGIAHRAGFVDPLQQWAPAEASPSGLAVAGDRLYLANLRGKRLREVPLTAPATSTESLTGAGRLRDAVVTPDGRLWVLTNNTDGRGSPGPDDDRLLDLGPA